MKHTSANYDKSFASKIVPVTSLCLRGWSVSLILFLSGLNGQATTVVPPKFAELVNESDYIVRAVVKSVKSEWREKNDHRHVCAWVELEVLEVVTGTPPQPLVLQMLGGRVGNGEIVIEGMPKFAAGHEDILFVRGNGRQFLQLTAAVRGRYPVMCEKNGLAYVIRNNLAPLREIAEVTLPMKEDSAAEISIRRWLLLLRCLRIVFRNKSGLR